MAIDDRLKEKREETLRLCGKYGARNVRVFGSVARGEADAESDVDLLVELEPGGRAKRGQSTTLDSRLALSSVVD